MFPEPTELLLIGCLIESIWTPRSKSTILTPITNSQTCWLREISHVMNGIIFCICSTSALSVLQIVQKWCRRERKTIQVKKESQQSRNRWWIWYHDTAKGLLMCYFLLHQKARRKPDMKVNFFWAREQSSITEQGDLLLTLTHQATQNGMLIKLGLLKSGNLMNWWKIEQGDLSYSHSTRTNSLLKTKNGFLHQSRIRNVVRIQIILAQVNDQVRKRQNQCSKDATKDIDRTFCDMGNVYVFYIASICIHGKDYSSDNLHSIKNTEDLTMKQMFDMSEKLITEQSDKLWNKYNQLGRLFLEVFIIGWWWRSHQSLAHKGLRIFRFCIMLWKDEREPTIKYCMGRQIDVVPKFTRIQDVGQNWCWANGIRVEHLPRIHHIAALQRSPRCTVKIERTTRKFSLDGLSSCRCSNDISWGSKDNENECESSAQLVSLYAKRFSAGQLSFLGPGSAKKWDSTHEYNPQGEWDSVAELMMVNFGESKHPVFWSMSPLSRGVLKSKGGGKLSIHFCADGETLETVFRTIISVNQLSIYGAVSDMCEECNTCHDRTGRLVVAGQSHPLFAPANLLKKIYCKDIRNELKSNHNKTEWLNFVLLQDSWPQLKSDSFSWQKTLKNSRNLQNQWHVVSTHCQETKFYLNQKVGFGWTPKLGPYWKSQPAAYKVNMEWKLELSL